MAQSLVGASFAQYVKSQIKLRQEKYALTPSSPNDEFLAWKHSNTAFIKLSSGIDISGDNGATARKYQLFNTQFNGNNLASGVGLGGNTAYGWESDSSYGFAVPPGIVSADIKAQNRGSLREANIDILCSNKKQFDIISKLYLRLGYTMLLEWGWSTYYSNTGTFHVSYHNLANQINTNWFFDGNSTPQSILKIGRAHV